MGNTSTSLHETSNFLPTAPLTTRSCSAISIRSLVDEETENSGSEKKAWDIVFKGDVTSWLSVAAHYGLKEGQVDCTPSHPCDRDYICHCYLSVIHKRWKKALQIMRFKEPPLTISVGKHRNIERLFTECSGENLLVVAVSRHIAVLEMAISERRKAFSILNMKKKSMVAVYEPDFLLTLVEGEISPDLSRTGLLLYSSSQHPEGLFTLDLFLISNSTGELLSRTCLGTDGIQPHFAFHPLYQWSHIVATQYSKQSRKLVILNLLDESCVCLSSPSLASIVGYQQLFPSFSPDGRFLILRKLSGDTYIFSVGGNTFHLIRYIGSKIPATSHSCRVWYKPNFSLCGQYLRLLNPVKNKISVVVYRLPSVLELKSRCRQVIMSCLQSRDTVELLPLPNSLKEYLMFSPILNG